MRRRRRRLPAAGDPRAAVPPADLGRRAHGQPADPAVPGRRGGRARAPAAAPAQPRRARAGRARMAAARVGRAVRAAGALLGRPRPRRPRTSPSSTCRSRCCSCCCATCAGRRELLLRCLGVAVALAVVFAGIGFVEYARKSLFLNPKVVAANQYDNYFRVNSLFFDPNIYGRFLALVMIAVTTVVLWRARRRDVLACGGRARVAAGGPRDELLAVEHRRAAARPGGARGVSLGACAGRSYVAGGARRCSRCSSCCSRRASLHFGLKGTGGSTSNATSGRTKLIEGGLELFAERPLQGYGSGSFQTRVRAPLARRARRTRRRRRTRSRSRSPPSRGSSASRCTSRCSCVAFVVLFRGAGRSPPRIAIAACFAALVLHTSTYADFLEDPLTWTLLGDRRRARARRRGRRRAGEPRRPAARPAVAA